jgi:hypothetical protein
MQCHNRAGLLVLCTSFRLCAASHSPEMPQSSYSLAGRFDSGDRRMGSAALETLPVVQCPGCGQPMDPTGSSVPVTRELDDISYVCPKCRTETKRTIKRA